MSDSLAKKASYFFAKKQEQKNLLITAQQYKLFLKGRNLFT